jgi:hypothetical protein
MAANKYGAKRTEVDGIWFASKAEARYYLYLKKLQDTGVIEALELQPRFELAPAIRLDGKVKRPLIYIADFRYRCTVTGNVVVVDVKGRATPAYRIKRHLLKHIHGIDLHEVRL